MSGAGCVRASSAVPTPLKSSNVSESSARTGPTETAPRATKAPTTVARDVPFLPPPSFSPVLPRSLTRARPGRRGKELRYVVRMGIEEERAPRSRRREKGQAPVVRGRLERRRIVEDHELTLP